jgi:hypothetical protein
MKTPLVAVLVLAPLLVAADPSSPTTKPSTGNPTTTSPTTTGANPSIPDPTMELQVMTERIKLTPSQQAAIKPILVAEFKKRKAIEDNTSLTVQQKHDQTGTVHRAALQEIKAIFTPAQLALIEQEQDHPVVSSTNPSPGH